MRIYCILLIFPILYSCSNTQINEDLIIEEESDEDIEYPSLISWNDLFLQKDDEYYAYVFSYTCHYCNETKKDIINFSNQSVIPVYFVEYTKDIQISYGIIDTIGKSSLNEIFIKGTPTILLIKDRVVVLNIAGVNEIKNLISIY